MNYLCYSIIIALDGNLCFNKLKKLILDGPKYLAPLIEEMVNKSFSIFFNEPEKLFQVAFSLSIFSTVNFGKQVKLPNLIEKTLLIDNDIQAIVSTFNEARVLYRELGTTHNQDQLATRRL